MVERRPRTHVVFTPSAGLALRQALAPEGSRRDVLCAPDDFSFGPIGRSPDERVRWVERHLKLAGWRGVVAADASFLAAVPAATGPVIAWASFRDSYSHAGLLRWLAQAGATQVLLADAAVLRDGNDADILAECSQAARIPADRRRRWGRRWRALEAQNAPFRVIEHGEMVSAPIDHFDAGLLAVATREWMRMAHIAGRLFSRFEQAGVFQTSDAVLAARLAALARDGQLEARGDLADMAKCEMRLPVR